MGALIFMIKIKELNVSKNKEKVIERFYDHPSCYFFNFFRNLKYIPTYKISPSKSSPLKPSKIPLPNRPLETLRKRKQTVLLLQHIQQQAISALVKAN